MHIKTVNYRRVKNLGNYESKTIELIAELAEGESAEEAIDKLAEIVDEKLGLKPPKINMDEDITSF